MAMDLLQFNDLNKSGDIDRLTIVMKRLYLTFIGLTLYRCKYAIECVNFLTETQWFCYLCILHLLRIILSLGCKVFILANPRMQ